MNAINIAEAFEEMITEAIENSDKVLTEDHIEKMIDDKIDDIEIAADKVNGLDRAIESAIDDYDMSDKIAEALPEALDQDAIRKIVREELHRVITGILNV